MAPPPRASERSGAGLRRDPRAALLLALSAAGALAACRQTVVLAPALTPDAATNGAAGGSGLGGHMNGDAGEDGGAGNGGNGGGGSSGNHADGGHADGAFCPGGQDQPLLFTMRTPDVVFSVDRSAGMQTWFGTGSRLQVIQDQIDALVAKYQKLVRFGYEEFPGASGMGMCSGGQGCCAGAVVPPTSNALKFIDSVRTPCTTTAGTGGMGGGSNGGPPSGCASQTARPTADALMRCDKTFSMLAAFPTTAGNRYVILLTGGDPSCMGTDPMSTPCNDALNAVVRLNRDSVGTAVFGVGEEAMGSQCLGLLAGAGGIEAGGASPYFLALTPTALSVALSPVVETIAAQACQIDIRQPPADPTKVALLFDGVAVNQDGVDGWDFETGSTVKITINGAACDTLLQDAPHVDLVSGCSSPHH
jgi:hypothetical protein